MTIIFHPKPGTVVICDYTEGFRVPEMVKKRPAIVVSPQIHGRYGLCTIVPISTRIPTQPMAYHVELPSLKLPAPFGTGPNWVKADMLFSAAYSRIDLFKGERDAQGRRRYLDIRLGSQAFRAVQKAILCALGMESLTKHM